VGAGSVKSTPFDGLDALRIGEQHFVELTGDVPACPAEMYERSDTPHNAMAIHNFDFWQPADLNIDCSDYKPINRPRLFVEIS
jgi:hypothetical protein